MLCNQDFTMTVGRSTVYDTTIQRVAFCSVIRFRIFIYNLSASFLVCLPKPCAKARERATVETILQEQLLVDVG